MKYEIGKRIRSFREQSGLSQKELAGRIGVSNARLSNWEQGLNRPDADTIPAICEALSISPNDLLNVPSTPTLTPKALEVAKAYDALDSLGKELVEAVLRIERKRPRGMRAIPVIGTIDATGAVEMKYAARMEQKELAAEAEKAEVQE